MASNKTTNVFSQGLNLSVDPSNQAKDTYSYGLNGVKENIINNPEVITNEKGFTTYLNLGYQYILLGTRYLGKKDYLFFIKEIDTATTKFNRILLVEDGVVTKVVADRLDLNFSSSHPIMSTYRLNYKNQRIVYFVDGLNADRVINIDIDTTAYDITLFSINSAASRPKLEATVVDNGGALISGQYFIAISYNIGESYTTEPVAISKPISIASEDYYNNVTVTEDITKLFGQTDGDVIPTPTRKSIVIDTTELDENFDSYNIIVLRQEESTNIVRVVKNISPLQTSFTFTGYEGDLDDTITLNDIIATSINYYASEAIIQKDNRLLRGNSKLKASSVDYQAFANNIVVKYKINEELVYDLSNVNGYRTDNQNDGGFYDAVPNVAKKHSISPSYLANTANNDPDNKTLMRDEVYSLGVSFELTDGTETDVYHIPGRPINFFSTVPTGVGEYNRAFSPSWDDDIVEGQPRWKVRNTAVKQSTGELAYWRSSEVYPDNYKYPTNGEKDGSGKSFIRHHKMPSDVLEPIYRTEITGNPNKYKGETTNYKIYKRNLGLEFSNIVIPVELQTLVKRVKFHYTPRDSSNKSILSKGIINRLFNNTTTSQLEQPRYLNYELLPGSAVDKFEFISPEVNFNFKTANLSGSKIKVCGIDKGYVNYAGAKQNIDPNGPYYINTFNNQLYDDTQRRQGIINAFCFYNQRAIPKEEIYSRDINKLIYVDGNYNGTSDIGNLYFAGSQPTGALQLITPLQLKPSTVTIPLSDYYPELMYPSNNNISNQLYVNFANHDSGSYPGLVDRVEEKSWSTNLYYDTTYYIQVMNSKSNLYGTMNNLKFIELGSTSYTSGNTITATVNGGDTFIDVHHFRQNKVVLTSRNGSQIPYAINVEGAYNSGGVNNVDNILTEVFEVGTQSYGSFFCETDINIRMRREGSTDDEKYFPKSYYNNTNVRSISKLIDNKEFYKIETPYNNQFIKPYFIAYVDNDTLADTGLEDIRYYTRIIYSDKQSLEDKSDNYRKVRANNYRDLPLDKGGISIFFVSKEKLFAITRDTVFNVYTSNQSLQSLNETNITVGTGEFLGVEPIDLVSIDGGFAGTTSKLSFVESPYGYLFVDRYKGRIILFNDQLDDIGIKDVNKFIKDNFNIKAIDIDKTVDIEFDNPLNNYGYICGFDAELNRFLITKLDYVTNPNADLNYKGIFDPTYPYVVGDTYTKDGVLYQFIDSGSELFTYVDTSNLSDFMTNNVQTAKALISVAPTYGTITGDNHSGLGYDYPLYTPTTGYAGNDSFTLAALCGTTVVNVTIAPPAPVTINYNIARNTIPFVDGNMSLQKNGSTTDILTFIGSGVSSGDYRIGDTLTVNAFHYHLGYRWPDDASLTLTIKKDSDNSVVYTYTGGLVNVADIISHSLVLDETSYTVSITTASFDTSLITLGYDLSNETTVPDGVVLVSAIDTTTSIIMLGETPSQIPVPSIGGGTRSGAYNMKDDANPQTIVINNTGGTNISVRLQNQGSYDQTFNLLANTSVNKTGLGKSGIIVTVKDYIASPTTAWRVQQDSYFCVLDGSGNKTGMKGWGVLEQYYTTGGANTGVTKSNTSGDANYVAPVSDTTTCVPGSTAPVFCGIQTQYDGAQAYPSITEINLGAGLGNVVLQAQAFAVPDKFVVMFDGVEVINTGYRGNIGYQTDLNNSLASRGLPPEPIVGDGTVNVSFNKTTSSSIATVYVYAPLGSTGWNFKLNCPT